MSYKPKIFGANRRPAIHTDGRAILVSGASSGIGYTTAQLLADRGFHVYAGARKRVDIEDLSRHKNITGIRLDVTSADEIAAAVKLVESDPARLFGIVNNAGIISCAPLIEVDEHEVKKMFDVNVYGAYRVTKAFASMIIESRGRIANISSVSGYVSNAFNGLYGMTKHALEAFSDSLAAEMEYLGVSVSSVMPSSYNSQLGKNMLARMAGRFELPEQSLFEEQMTRRLAFFARDFDGVLEEPSRVAEAVFHAMTSSEPRSRYLVVRTKRESWRLRGKILRRVLRMSDGHSRSSIQKKI